MKLFYLTVMMVFFNNNIDQEQEDSDNQNEVIDEQYEQIEDLIPIEPVTKTAYRGNYLGILNTSIFCIEMVARFVDLVYCSVIRFNTTTGITYLPGLGFFWR